MALRIRADGRILCAAIHKEEPGDTYLHDGISEILTGCAGEQPVIVTEPWDRHHIHGQWWWVGNVPEHVQIKE